MADQATADVLLELERRRLAALVEGDAEAAEEVHADDYELITPGGVPLSKREYLDAVASGELDYRVFEVAGDLRVRASEGVGILRYLARIEIDVSDGHDEGWFWHTDVYERRGDQWQVVWSQATRTRTEGGGQD